MEVIINFIGEDIKIDVEEDEMYYQDLLQKIHKQLKTQRSIEDFELEPKQDVYNSLDIQYIRETQDLDFKVKCHILAEDSLSLKELKL